MATPAQNIALKPASPLRRVALSPWLPVVVGGLCFLNVIGNDFVRDDTYVVSHNPRIRSVFNWQGIWLSNWWYVVGDDANLPPDQPDRLYRPFTLFTFALNYAIAPLDATGRTTPGVYLFTNVLLHAITCGLIWLLTRRLLGDELVATVAALLFAVHPIHCEAVANAVGRADILGALFLAAGMIMLLPRRGAPDLRRGLAAAGLFFVALLSKESAACYIGLGLVLLALRWRETPPDRRAAWAALQAGLLLLPLAAYLPLRYAVLGDMAGSGVQDVLVNPLIGTSGLERWIGVFTIAGHYTRAMLFPMWLSSDYGLAVIDPRGGADAITWLGVGATLLLGAALAGFASRSPSWRRIAVVALLFLLSYGLLSNAVLLIGTSLGERLFYWPSALFGMLLALLIVRGLDRASSRPAVVAITVLVLVALAVRATVRNTDWRSGARLAAVDVANWPRSAQLQVTHAWHLGDAAARHPNSANAPAMLEQAQRHAEESLRICPENTNALKILAEILLARGDHAAATDVMRKIVAATPDDWLAHANLTMLLADRDPAAALRHAREAYRLQPQALQTRLNLAQALADNGLRAEALDMLRLAERDMPANHQLRPAVAEMIRVLAQAGSP